ncbi:MAG TPA: MaoC/PaaZ C-terminal domain-containing protein [bacterium]|nr:MaoC/PaaZ C-terminal domain-containing protein [bacterium]
MPELNKAVIGKVYPPGEVEIKGHESMYYALATNDPNPWYINGSREGGVIAPPMFAVNYGGGALASVFFDQEVGQGFMAFLVHGEQEIEWFKVVKPGQKVLTAGKIQDIQDKGSGELLIVESSTKLVTGEPVCRQLFSFFVRGYGKLEKKAKTPEPEEDKSNTAFESKERVLVGQSYVYAEPSGDHNPIHVNEDFAKKVGLGGIILQGLCTLAFCHKAVVQNACGGDPTSLRKFSVRFSKPVRPTDVLTIKGWWMEKDKLLGFEAANPAGEPVIKNGRAELGKVSL